MSEVIRARDAVVWFKDDATTVVVDSAMVAAGWPGGQGVQWVESPNDEILVTFSDGHHGGFLVWGSDEEGDDFTAMTRSQPLYRFATMLYGSTLFSTSSYERYTLTSRLAGPLVPLTYTVNDTLFLSLRGLWTTEDELTISAAPSAPATPAGIVAQVPKSLNNLFLSVQTTM